MSTAVGVNMKSIIANLGDANFIQYGGRLVFSDDSDTQRDPWMEVIEEPPEDDEEEEIWTIYRFDLERFQIVEDGNHLYLVSKNWDKSWPHALSSYDEWFHRDLKSVAESMSIKLQELRSGFCSEDPLKRAMAWCTIGDYYGFHELDSYPLKLSKQEILKRYDLEE